MRTKTTLVTVLASGLALVALTAGADKPNAKPSSKAADKPVDKPRDGFVRIAVDDVVWRDRPGYDGVKFAVIEGDPAKPGLYVIRAKFAPGTMTRPHWHPENRYVTVLQGTWYTGEGDTFEPDKTLPLKAGGYMLHPGNAHHYDGAKDDEVIVQIVGIGPSNTTLIHPEQGNTGPSRKPSVAR